MRLGKEFFILMTKGVSAIFGVLLALHHVFISGKKIIGGNFLWSAIFAGIFFYKNVHMKIFIKVLKSKL